jgi:putative endonuclease
MGSDRLASRPGTGRRAEELAAALLERAGLRVVARNWRRPEGELDVVAVDADGCCVFVEVRSRTGTELGHPLESITADKRRRVIRSARLYLAETTTAATAFRFDVVAVTFAANGAEPELVHIPNAFEVA